MSAQASVKKAAAGNLAVLEQIIETASNNFDLKEILAKIVEIIGKITRCDSCFIYLIFNDQVILKASLKPHHTSLSKIKMKLGEGITGWVAEHKKTVVIPTHAYQDKRFKLFTNLPEDRFEGFLSVPIIFRNKVIGVINVQHRKTRIYTKTEISFLETIGKQIGGILEVSRLITETDVLKEALAVQKVINRAKAILMKTAGLDEDAAHRLLIKKSMDKRKTLKEVAEAIILAQDLTR